MPILKHTRSHGGGASHPYPSWSMVADTVGLRQQCAAQDRRAEKEARLWRELADEPSAAPDRPIARR